MTTAHPAVDPEARPGARRPSGPAGTVRRGLPPMVLAAILVASVVAGVTLGSTGVPFGAGVRIIWAHLVGGTITLDDAPYDAIVWQIRLPRVLLGALAGAALAVCGAVLQSVLRNPLADPFILGLSYSAGVGAVSVTLAGAAFAGVYTLSAGAFAGASAGTLLVFLLAGARRGGGASRLLLAGVAVSLIAHALITTIVMIGDSSGGQAARAVMFWLMGGLGSARWGTLTVAASVTALAVPLLVLRARALDALLLGEQTAASLGLRPPRLRVELFAITALLVGTLVAVAGAIGFIGLIMPLFTRLLLRTAENAVVLPFAALLGAVFLIWADLAARMVLAPAELPVGAVTALVGGPVFLWLLVRRPAGDGFGGAR